MHGVPIIYSTVGSRNTSYPYNLGNVNKWCPYNLGNVNKWCPYNLGNVNKWCPCNLGNRNTVQLIVIITDVNDNAPQFPSDTMAVFINENSLRNKDKT